MCFGNNTPTTTYNKTTTQRKYLMWFAAEYLRCRTVEQSTGGRLRRTPYSVRSSALLHAAAPQVFCNKPHQILDFCCSFVVVCCWCVVAKAPKVFGITPRSPQVYTSGDSAGLVNAAAPLLLLLLLLLLLSADLPLTHPRFRTPPFVTSGVAFSHVMFA